MLASSDLFSVRGRTALVTGGATGLGRVCAEALLTAGARVLIVSRKAEACAAAAAELSAIGPREGFGGTVATEAGVAAPGPFPTKMTQFALGDEKGAERGASAVPMRWLGRPEDIAGALLFLTGRGGAYTTGAILPVDGGVSVTAPPAMFGDEP